MKRWVFVADDAWCFVLEAESAEEATKVFFAQWRHEFGGKSPQTYMSRVVDFFDGEPINDP